MNPFSTPYLQVVDRDAGGLPITQFDSKIYSINLLNDLVEEKKYR